MNSKKMAELPFILLLVDLLKHHYEKDSDDLMTHENKLVKN